MHSHRPIHFLSVFKLQKADEHVKHCFRGMKICPCAVWKALHCIMLFLYVHAWSKCSSKYFNTIRSVNGKCLMHNHYININYKTWVPFKYFYVNVGISGNNAQSWFDLTGTEDEPKLKDCASWYHNYVSIRLYWQELHY